MLLLDERIRADGGHARTWAAVEGERLALRDDDGAAGAPLPIAALERVMIRYGRPLDPELAVEGEALALPGGSRLRRLRYHAAVDATGRDYLVWERPGDEPLVAIAATVTAALRYLASEN